MGPIRAAVADGVITFMWVFCVSTVGAFTAVIASALGVTAFPLSILITTSLIAFLVFVFTVLGNAVGGASFNPTGTAAFYAAGLSKDSLVSMALRFPAQAAGAAGGALAIMEYMPPKYKHMLRGPSLKVDLHTGAAAEGILTFVITMAVLWIVVKGPANQIIKTWMLAAATVALVITGSGFTGPSMNPANAFGWAYVNNRHNTWEQFYVYWICPFIGAILAGWCFRIIFPLRRTPKAQKTKKED